VYSSGELPWKKIHEFLLDVGNIRHPRELCVEVVRKIGPLIPFDQARVYFVNDSGKIYDQVLVGVDRTWSDVYLDYYSRIEGGRYSIPARLESRRYSFPKFAGGIYDWTRYEGDQFMTEYIRPQRLHYSAGFGFHDADGLTKSVYVLDRTGPNEYTQREIDIMATLQPHLDNLHRNLYVLSSTGISNGEARKVLTAREAQIAGLLCKGMTPAKIARALSLSLPTVYRHIANIHAKLDVSNRQELLLKLMGSVEFGVD
jgi:DNA-binding CsgD family transcriptional regulator